MSTVSTFTDPAVAVALQLAPELPTKCWHHSWLYVLIPSGLKVLKVLGLSRLSLVMKATTVGGAGAEVTGGDFGDGGGGGDVVMFGEVGVVGVVTAGPGWVMLGVFDEGLGGGIGVPIGPGAEGTPAVWSTFQQRKLKRYL